MIFDTHCHIHDKDFPIELSEVFENMQERGIAKAICIGVDAQNSQRAVDFCKEFSSNTATELFAAIGTHPHEAKDFDFEKDILLFEELSKSNKVVAVGEIGLDYFYNNSPKEIQAKVLKEQIKFAVSKNLPISFHVRDAYDDFWPIFDECERDFGKIRGVLHSFTDNISNLKKALERDLFIGVNGISTFVKKTEELEMFAKIPLEKILLETDAPFLAPKGKRGQKNQPAFVRIVAEDLAEKRGISLKEVAEITSKNARELFKI